LYRYSTDPPFRLIAMSATVNAELFQSYFEKVVPGPCVCVEIPGRTFPVVRLYTLNSVYP
jgi:HrpA-like RNA helicase